MKLKRKPGFFQELIRNRVLYIMFIPITVYYILLAYIPMSGITMAFQEFSNRTGIWRSPWIGLKNFEFFFKSGKALEVTLNTLGYNFLFLVCYTFFSILVAVVISEISGKFFKRISHSAMFLPYFISWVVVSAMAYSIFNYEHGIINSLLQKLGAPPVDVYSTPSAWPIILPLLYTWKWVGFGSVIYLAAIMGIDPEIFDAAKIDGANIYQRLHYITFPSLKPTAIILILLALGRILRGEFDMFFNLIGNNGLLIAKTDIIDTLVFRSIVGTQDFGMAAAAGFYQSVLCFFIIIIANSLVKKYDKDQALF